MTGNYGCGRIIGPTRVCGKPGLCNVCFSNVELCGLLRECVPFLQRARFGNPGADALLERIEKALTPEEK